MARPRVLATVVVVDLVAIAAVTTWWFVLRDDDEDLPVVDAAAALDGILGDVDPERNTSTDIGRCPLGDVGTLVGALGVEGGALPERGARVRGGNDDLGVEAGVECAAEDGGDDLDDQHVVGLIASGAPAGDLEAAVERGLPGGEARVGGREDHRGGELLWYCWRLPGEQEVCGAEWAHRDADLRLTLYSTGVDRDDEAAADALRSVLPEVVGSLADAPI